MSIRYWARDGSEITLEQWSALLGDLEYKRVGWTKVGDVIVSTVWLGLEHAFLLPPDTDSPVHIFETMVFGPSEFDDNQWRYGTEAAALDGHARVVELVRIAHQLQMPDAQVERPAQKEQT
jgi:hypothetical protein